MTRFHHREISALREPGEDVDQFALTGYELGFLRGVFASRGLAEPGEEDYLEALELLQLHSVGTHNPN